MFDLELQETHENGSVMSWDGADRDSGFEREPLKMASRIHRSEQVPGPLVTPWSAREAFGLNEILSLDVLGGKIPKHSALVGWGNLAPKSLRIPCISCTS